MNSSERVKLTVNDTLTTERLLLRQWRESDIDAYAAICADPQVMRYLTGKTFDRLETWRHIAFMVGHWQLKGFGHWAVEERETGQLIGRLGFLQPDGWPGFEIGWTLASATWGKGYATEGAFAALDYGFNQLKQPKVISIIHPQNNASKAVALRIGESYQSDTVLMGMKVEIWGMDNPQFALDL